MQNALSDCNFNENMLIFFHGIRGAVPSIFFCPDTGPDMNQHPSERLQNGPEGLQYR